jgi:dipeptidyl aminopeptidase/acylaminoacyl peptidase
VDILADALRKAEVPVEYVLVKNAGHGLVAPADAKAKGLPDQVPSRVEVTDSTIQFLNKYLKPST